MTQIQAGTGRSLPPPPPGWNAPGPAATPAFGHSPVRSRPSNPKRVYIIVTAVVVAIVVILVSLAVIPISHSYAFSLTSCPTAQVTQTYPQGATVEVRWYITGGTITHFLIRTLPVSLQTTIYDWYGSNGSFAFTAGGSSYVFSSYGCQFSVSTPPVQVLGQWSAPIL